MQGRRAAPARGATASQQALLPSPIVDPHLATATDLLWPALLLPVAWGLLSPRTHEPSAAPWRWGADLGLALLCGLALAGLSGWWLARFAVPGGPFLTSDFHDYCATLHPQAAGDIAALTRSRGMLAAALPAALVQRVGVVDALAWGALAGVAATGAGLYLWGRAVHGRLAGCCAALAAGTIWELATFSRTLSFYPEITGGLALSTGAAAVALRFPGLRTLLLGALGVALAFLVDLRGLIWGLSCGGLVLLACLRGPRWTWPLKLAVLAAVIVGAWRLGPRVYQPQLQPLEAHTDLRKRLEDNGVAVPADFPEPDTTYVWGRSDPRQIPRTLLQLRAQAAAVPPELRDVRSGHVHRTRRVEPWRGVATGAALLALLGTLRGRDRLVRAVLLVGLSLPWLASLQGAVAVQRSFPRFLGSGAPVLALALGVAFATLVHGPRLWHRAPPPRTWRTAVKPVGAVLLGLLLVLGAVPSWLSPAAPWREPVTATNGHLWKAVDWLEGARQPRGQEVGCAEGLAADRAAGLAWRGTLFGGIPER